MKTIQKVRLLALGCLLPVFSAIAPVGASAKNTINLIGVEYDLDTVAHVKVGPGTTTTYLRLTAPGKQLQVHYLTIDKSTPGVNIQAVCSRDMVAGTEQVSKMAARKTTKTKLYFAGANADFYSTGGSATNGTSQIGTPTTSCIVDGEIYKSSNSQYQFTIDKDGVAAIGRLNYYTGTAVSGDMQTLFKGINVSSPNNGITIYTPKYWGSTNQNAYAGSSYEVTAKLVEGDSFTAGGKFRLEVTSDPNDTGDTKVPDDGFVIHGRGTSTSGVKTSALNFVKALKPGDIVELDNIILLDGNRIYPVQTVSGNPKNVGAGETLDSEGERTDAVQLHPRTGIGVSKDGNTIIMMVVEGRHSGSNGVRTSQLADIMRYAGAYEAVNLDGGGSSTLYTAALGVRNVCSDGVERAVGNGIFATMELPAEDNTITEIGFEDFRMTIPRFTSYTPRILGYNKYGVVVNSNLKGFTLEIAPAAGKVSDDGSTLFADGTGYHALKATYGDCEASIPVTIEDSGNISANVSSLFIDGKQEFQVEVSSSNGEQVLQITPSVLSWTSADAAIATVSPEGVIKGTGTGNTTITGTLGTKSVEIPVRVEIATESAINIVKGLGAVENWKLTSSGCTTASTVLTPAEDGYALDFRTSSNRAPSITLTAQPSTIRIWSIPDDVTFTVTNTTELKKAVIKIKNALGNTLSFTTDAIPAGENQKVSVNLGSGINLKDLSVFPLEFVSMLLYPPTVTGTEGKVAVSAIDAEYGDVGAVGEIISDAISADGKPEYYNLQGIRVENPGTGLYIIRQGGKAQKVIR